MAIEQLTDTDLFSRVRIPLADFVDFPRVTTLNKASGQLISRTELPSEHLRCRPGFYRHSRFTATVFPYLQPRPSQPKEQHLIIWRLKKAVPWMVVQRNFEGKHQPVPWWVIRPLLKYVASGERSLVDASHKVPFLIQFTNRENKTSQETVSLELCFLTLHAEWWLDVFTPENKDPCYAGQTFLSAG